MSYAVNWDTAEQRITAHKSFLLDAPQKMDAQRLQFLMDTYEECKGVFAGVAEMVARALVGFLFVPLWGYFAACIASPVAWFFACFFLIPAYIVVYRRLKKEKLVPHANL